MQDVTARKNPVKAGAILRAGGARVRALFALIKPHRSCEHARPARALSKPVMDLPLYLSRHGFYKLIRFTVEMAANKARNAADRVTFH